MKDTFLFLGALAALFLVGCGSQADSGVYESRHVGEVSRTARGTILQTRSVRIEHGDQFGDNALGGTLGAITGGILGNQIGGGKGKALATVGGAVGGGILGAKLQKGGKPGTEYVVELDSGETVTVVQGVNPPLSSGQRVLVIYGQAGRSRIILEK